MTKHKMTNREWLATLSNRELAQWILYECPSIAHGYSDSVWGLEKWLGEGHIE